jgi:hypothetical protein
MTKLIVAFRNFANAPKMFLISVNWHVKESFLWMYLLLYLQNVAENVWRHSVSVVNCQLVRTGESS